MRDGDMGQTRTCSHAQRMAQSQGWVKRYFKAFCKGFFVAVPVAVTFLDQVACVARVEGASMQPSLNPDGSRSSDVVLLNHWEVRNFKVHRGDIVSLVFLSHQLPLCPLVSMKTGVRFRRFHGLGPGNGEELRRNVSASKEIIDGRHLHKKNSAC
ncbi:mitochondrial inner membrane protease subunit 2-like isoform 2-T2 [Molossus nigricans]